MNAQRRKRIDALIVKMQEISTEIEELQSEERDAFDNLPESIQYSERGEQMERSADSLEEAQSDIDSIINNLEEIISQ